MPGFVVKRPKVISIFCVVGFVISAFQIILISYPGIRNIAQWYPIVYGLLTALRFMSLVGTWHMKKWGAELFTYTILAKIAIQVFVGDFGGTSLADTCIAIVFSIVFMSFHRRMDRIL